MKGLTIHGGASPILRWGGAAIGLLCLAYGLMALDDLADGWRRRTTTAEAELAQRRQLVATAPLWVDARRQAEADAAGLQAMTWRAPSEGQARAQIQDWISQGLIALGAEKPVVRIDRVSAGPSSDLFWIHATVGGGMPVPALERWLAQMAGAERLVLVDRLRVQSQPAARFEAVLSLPARIGGAP